MMKRNFLLLIMSLWVAWVAAQKYHDAAAFDLRGNVKEYVVKSGNDGKAEVYRFTSDGALSCRMGEEIGDGNQLERDASGYLIRCTLGSLSYSYDYDGSHRKTNETMVASGGILGPVSVIMGYRYNSNGYVEVEASITNTSKGFSYAYTQYDNNGNWTERKVYDLATKEFKYKESREITYWKASEKPKENTNVSEVESVKRLPKNFPPAKAKEGDIKQLILHPFGAKNLHAKCTADELMSACEKMGLNAVSKVEAYGSSYGTIVLTEKEQITSTGWAGDDFKGVFCYKLFDAAVVAEAGFDAKSGLLFEWEYRLYPFKDSRLSIDEIFEKVEKALLQSGLKVRLKSSKDNSTKYHIYEVEGVGLEKVTVATAGWSVNIGVHPAFE